MTFKEWHKHMGGTNIVAKALDVSPYTVRFWIRGEGSPTFETAVRIVTLSHGKINFIQLFNFTTRNRDKK